LVTGQSVEEYQISPNGQWVVYRADQDTDNVIELYSVPIEGPMTAGIKLNGPLVPNGNVARFQISPDSSRVVYRADQEDDGVAEIFSVPISGPTGPVIKLNGNLVSGGDVSIFQISPDSSRVVYRADQDTDNVFELYSVPLGGETAGIKLNSNLVSGGDVSIFQISPGGNRVVYGADQDAFTRLELYSVSINGPTGSAIKLNGPLVANGEVSEFQISPDGNWVVYQADKDIDNVFELYSVPIGGPTGSDIKLNSPLAPNRNIDSIQISPNSRRVVYRADQDTDNVGEIFSVPIEGGTPGIKLNGLLLADEVVSFFLISPDSSRVVYQIFRIFDIQRRDLISVSIAGPVNGIINLSAPMTAGGSVRDFQISPDSSRVVFQADKQTAGVYELFSVPLGGPAAAVFKVNGPLATGGNAGLFQISRDSGRVIYMADQDTNDFLELYMTSNYSIHLPLILNGGTLI